jgi:hypothetical protein
VRPPISRFQTQAAPFQAANPLDTLLQVLHKEPVSVRQLNPEVPRDLETICLKCLEKEPARRYASAGELAGDLRRFLDDEPIQARPTPAWERAWKWGKRRPAIVALLGVSLAAIVAVVLLIVWHNISLQEELIQARADEREARRREQLAGQVSPRYRLKSAPSPMKPTRRIHRRKKGRILPAPVRGFQPSSHS